MNLEGLFFLFVLGLALLMGMLLGNGFRFWRHIHGLSRRLLFGIAVATGLTCRIAFALNTPIFYAPDEQSHFNYIKFLSESRAFPIQTSRTGDASNAWEYYQPPFYYLLMSPLYRSAAWLFRDEAMIVRTIRCASIGFWLFNVWLAKQFCHRAKLDDELGQAGVMSLVCLLPTYTFLSSMINNDNLLITFGGLVFYLLWRDDDTWRRSVGLGIVIGLALLTKLNAFVYIFAVFIFAVMNANRRRAHWRRTAIHFGVILVIAILFWSPWALRMYRVYGSVTAEQVANIPKAWASLPEAASYILRSLFRTFWAASGIRNNVYGYFPVIGIALTGIAGWGLAAQYLTHGKQRLPAMPWLAMLLTILFNLALIVRFGFLYGQAQGRFLFPLLVPLAACFSRGLRIIRWNDLSLRLVGLFLAYTVIFTLLSLWMFERLV